MEVWISLVNLLDGPKLNILAALLFAVVGTGIARAILSKEFALVEVGRFLSTKVLPLLLGYGGIGMVAVMEPTWRTAVPAVWALIVAALSAELLAHLKALGVPVPDLDALVNRRP